jgi:maltose O-acetyltransferase
MEMRELGAGARRIVMNQLVGSALVSQRVRTRLLRLLGMPLGKGALIGARTYLGGVDIEMGDGSGCNIDCVFDNYGPIRIGRMVFIGHQVMLLTSHHDVGGPGENVSGPVEGRGITIGDSSWIGARATIMPGVTIGEGCVVGAGAVVTRDCAPGGVYLGVPARRMRDVAAPTAVGELVPEQARAGVGS